MKPSITLMASLLMVSPAFSQSTGQAQPVDQAVADLDPLAHGMRRVDRGIRLDGEQSSLFAVPRNATQGLGDPANTQPVYYRVGPGFTARMDRGDYIVRRGEKDLVRNMAPRVDGEYIELVPPNTVFVLDGSLDPQSIPAPPQPTPDTAYYPRGGPQPVMPQRINNQIDGRVDRQVDRRIDNRVDHQNPHRPREVGFRTTNPW